MNQLEPYGKNLFFTIMVSKERIQKFGYNHLQRMISASNPNLAAAILSTTTCWENVFGNLEAYDDDLTMQRSLTKTVKLVITEFVDKALLLEECVVYKFRKGTPIYMEFYPHGRSEYHKLSLTHVLILMNRLIDKSTKYETEIGPEWKDELTIIRDNFVIQYADQQQKIGEVDGSTPDFDVKVGLLYVQMYKNLGLLISEYPETPSKLLTFYDQTIVIILFILISLLYQRNPLQWLKLCFRLMILWRLQVNLTRN